MYKNSDAWIVSQGNHVRLERIRFPTTWPVFQLQIRLHIYHQHRMVWDPSRSGCCYTFSLVPTHPLPFTRVPMHLLKHFGPVTGDIVFKQTHSKREQFYALRKGRQNKSSSLEEFWLLCLPMFVQRQPPTSPVLLLPYTVTRVVG